MRVSRLTTGVARAKAGRRGGRRYVVERWRDETIPVHAFLIEHPGALVVFDTGQTSRAAEPGWFPAWHPFFRLSRFELGPEDELAPQLRSRGIEPGRVDVVVLSHLHTDHVGGLDAFTGADVVVARDEWKQATGLEGRLRGYLPQRWPHGLEPRLIDLDGPAVGPFPASHDLLGDGTLSIVPAPGHTAGHVALLARAPDGLILLAGDLVHTAAELGGVAPRLAEWCDRENVTVLTAHDDRPWPKGEPCASGS